MIGQEDVMFLMSTFEIYGWQKRADETGARIAGGGLLCSRAKVLGYAPSTIHRI
jgi:hypothetical protein